MNYINKRPNVGTLERWKVGTEDREENPITFSVVVNTTDRAGSLLTLLRSLEHQSYPHFELVVVVGPTRDHTMDVLAQYSGRVTVLRCDEANLSKSRNIGLLAARGEIVAFIDDDAVPCRHWLAQFARLFQNPQLDGTGGVVYLIHPNDPMVQHRLGVTSSLGEQYNVQRNALENLPAQGAGRQWIHRMMGTNMAYRRQALLNVGGFDEYYVWVTDETDLIVRMVNAGHVIHPVKEAPVYHVPASSRNGVAFTKTGRWWIQSQSGVYFSVKNGRAAGDRTKDILLHGLHLLHGHWLWYCHLRREGRMPLPAFVRNCTHEIAAGLDGAIAGFLRKRRTIPPEAIHPARHTDEPIRPFQPKNSHPQQMRSSHPQMRKDSSDAVPTVDPITGTQPRISMPDEPLRLCLTSGLYPPEEFDGVGRHTNMMARGLYELGHTVHVIARGEREQVSYYDGAYVHRIPYALNRYPAYRTLPDLHHALNYSHAVHDKVKRLVLNDGVQLVDSPLWQIEGLVTAVSDLLPVAVRLQTSVSKVASIQRDRDRGKHLISQMERELLQRAGHLIPNSSAIADSVRSTVEALDDVPFTVVPHGIEPVDEEDIRPFPIDTPPSTLTVLYVGRLEKRKGIQTLFRAIPRIIEEFAASGNEENKPGVRFLLAGSDNSSHDGFRRRTGFTYPDFFTKHYPQCADQVCFLGHVSDEKLADLYRSCDLFVAPSLYESFGLIYLEAMNYAKPVIGCKAGGVPEVVDDGVSGLLVEPDAHEALAEAALKILNRPQMLYEMGLAGRQRLLDKFTHIQMARQFEQVYRQTLGTHVSHA